MPFITWGTGPTWVSIVEQNYGEMLSDVINSKLFFFLPFQMIFFFFFLLFA